MDSGARPRPRFWKTASLPCTDQAPLRAHMGLTVACGRRGLQMRSCDNARLGEDFVVDMAHQCVVAGSSFGARFLGAFSGLLRARSRSYNGISSRNRRVPFSGLENGAQFSRSILGPCLCDQAPCAGRGGSRSFI